jgi:nucleoside-diphosphate-sugar epimerase
VQVFLTGATGFIGGRLAEALSARGCRLRCLVRAPERATALAALGAELIVGDATDEAALDRGMRGADLTYNVAGRYDIGVVDEAAMEQVNVGGLRAFLNVLQRTGVPRAVHVSTTAALGPAPAGVEGDEDSVYSGPYPSVYHRTKTAAHHMARAAQRDGLPLVIACPALVYGPGDEGPSGRYIADVLRHRVPGLSTRPAVFSWAHVDDVVAGLIAAGERGRAGATYVLSGEPATVNEFTHSVAAEAGTWAPRLRFPPVMIRMTGRLLDGISRLTGARLPISRELVDVGGSGARWVHSSARAAAELGYAPRALEDGLPETVAWVRSRVSGGRST